MITAIQYEDKPNDPLMTAADFARHKKVSRQAVSKMVKRHGVKLDQDGRAPLSVWLEADAVGLAMDANTASARAAGSPAGSVSAVAAKEKAKKLQLERELLEIELAEAKGKTVPVEQMAERVRNLCGWCLRYMDMVVSRLALVVRDPALYEQIRDQIDGVKGEVCRLAADETAAS